MLNAAAEKNIARAISNQEGRAILIYGYLCKPSKELQTFLSRAKVYCCSSDDIETAYLWAGIEITDLYIIGDVENTKVYNLAECRLMYSNFNGYTCIHKYMCQAQERI